MIRLGLRLVVAGGRSSAVVIGLTALAVAFGTAILLFALSFEPALATRYNHAAWRDTPGELDLATATNGLMLARTDDHWQGRRLVRMDVAALAGDAPVPPGLPRVPAAGETFVSPALADLLVTTPADELGDRFGEVVGTIGPAGLMAPDELAAVVGRDAGSLRADGARVVDELNGTRADPRPHEPPDPDPRRHRAGRRAGAGRRVRGERHPAVRGPPGAAARGAPPRRGDARAGHPARRRRGARGHRARARSGASCCSSCSGP